MSLKIKQYVGYIDQNSITTGTPSQPWDVLKNEFVHAFGIQAPEGTQFSINGSNSRITIGRTQIYELDLRNGLGIINKIEVHGASLAETTTPNIIIDILYEDSAGDIATTAIEEAEKR